MIVLRRPTIPRCICQQLFPLRYTPPLPPQTGCNFFLFPEGFILYIVGFLHAFLEKKIFIESHRGFKLIFSSLMLHFTGLHLYSSKFIILNRLTITFYYKVNMKYMVVLRRPSPDHPSLYLLAAFPVQITPTPNPKKLAVIFFFTPRVKTTLLFMKQAIM